MLTPEQIKQIKSRLKEQISHLPEEQQAAAIEEIELMSPEQIETFISRSGKNTECIFCSIASGKTKSYPIEETENTIAVLDINPFVTGHTLVIPKAHVSILGEETESFTEKVSEKLKFLLNADKVEQEETTLSGHTIINLLPIYKDEKPSGERKKTTQEELKKLQEKIIKGSSETLVSGEKKEKPVETIKESDKPKVLEKVQKRRP